MCFLIIITDINQKFKDVKEKLEKENKPERYYEKAKENRDKYQKYVNFTITNLDRLQKHIRHIEGITNDIKRLKKALAL